MKRLFIIAFVFVLNVLVLFQPLTATAQCAMCRASVESNTKKDEASIGKNLNTGILYLMVIPYLLIGTIGFVWYRNHRKANS